MKTHNRTELLPRLDYRPTVNVFLSSTEHPNAIVIKIELLDGTAEARSKVCDAIMLTLNNL